MEEYKPYNQQLLSDTQEKKKRRKKFPNVFFKKELVAVFSQIDEPKIMAGAFLTFFCALRNSEVCNLKWDDIDLEQRRLKVVNGKNHKDGYVPISSICVPVLLKWKQMNKDEEYFLPNENQNKPHITPSGLLNGFKRALEKAGMSRIIEENSVGNKQHQYKFHTLRHSRCTHLLSNGVPIQKVQHFMRHDKIETTLTYTWILDVELNSMVESIDKPSAREQYLPERNIVIPRTEDALDIAKKRLAYGEINPKEYRKLMEALAK
jgi:integrase/recombinase XerD